MNPIRESDVLSRNTINESLCPCSVDIVDLKRLAAAVIQQALQDYQVRKCPDAVDFLSGASGALDDLCFVLEISPAVIKNNYKNVDCMKRIKRFLCISPCNNDKDTL